MAHPPSLPPALARELSSLPHPLATLRAHAGDFDRARAWCARALATTHLVAVASHLCRRHAATLEDLDALGFPTDLLAFFPGWRRGSRHGYIARGLGLRLAPAGAGHPLGSFRIQLSPFAQTIPYALCLLRDFLRRTDPGTRCTLVVEPGADVDALSSLIGEIAKSARDRVRIATARTQTVFARDNAAAMRDADGNPVLLLPRGFRHRDARARDEMAPADAERAFGLRAIRSPFYWEGGNVVYDDTRCLVGADTIVENMRRLGLTEDEVVHGLSATFGVDVTVLGEVDRARFDIDEDRFEESGQTSFHIDLDVALLGRFGRNRRPVALVADPSRGLDLLPAVLRHRPLFEDHFLSVRAARARIEAQYDAYARERHPRLLGYAATLESLGYRVVGMPDVRVDPKENVFRRVNLDFSYCNVLPGLHQARPAVHYLRWGIAALDASAEKQFRAAGVEPIAVSPRGRLANELMTLQGGLRCACGPLP